MLLPGNMILILSEENDESTCHVIDWLNHSKKSFFRINSNDRIVFQKFSKTTFIIKVKGQLIDSDKIEAFWYRKGPLNNVVDLPYLLNNQYYNDLKFHLLYENNTLIYMLHNILLDKTPLSNHFTRRVNKLEVLHLAEQCGLTTPKTLVTSEKTELVRFINKYGKVITKPLDGPLVMQNQDDMYMTYTEMITDEFLTKLPDTFFPGYFQQNIEKKYEIRVFSIKNEHYAMCIFSQTDEQTSVDFRRYNWTFPNRTVPYDLPAETGFALSKLLHDLGLNTASSDIIVTPDDEYVFLEVNPVGQFGMVSFPCNYYLEKIIADNIWMN